MCRSSLRRSTAISTRRAISCPASATPAIACTGRSSRPFYGLLIEFGVFARPTCGTPSTLSVPSCAPHKIAAYTRAASMLRKLLMVGVVAGSSAAIPVIYQSNPEAFHSFLKSAVEKQDTVKKQPAMPRLAAAKAEPDSMTGRKVRLAADARGHFTGAFKLNGRPVEALVDT